MELAYVELTHKVQYFQAPQKTSYPYTYRHTSKTLHSVNAKTIFFQWRDKR